MKKSIQLLIGIVIYLLSVNTLCAQETGTKDGDRNERDEGPNRVSKITVNAQSGKVQALNNENENIDINYVKKGNRVEVEVTEIGANQWATIEVSQKDINITGDDLIQPINPSDYQDENVKDTDLEELKAEEDEIQVQLNDDNPEIELTDVRKNELNRKLEVINLTRVKQKYKNELDKLAQKGVDIHAKDQVMKLTTEVKSTIADLNSELSKMSDELKTEDEYLQCLQIGIKLDLLKDRLSKLKFVKYMYFTPEKEEIDLKVKINTLEDSKVTSNELYSETLITAARFKMFGSIGVHGLIYNDTELANRDSLIVSGDRTKFKPSFGTYLNATWRCNDFWTGFGFGTGIPINVDGDNDLTPNFNLFYTMIFQAGQSRMGFNLGMAVQRTSVLQVGYADGDNLGSASESVPVNQVWKPAFMFGVTYNLGGTDK